MSREEAIVMIINVDARRLTGEYIDPTSWQNTTLRYTPPKDFPEYLAKCIGKAKIMRVFITLDEYWEIIEDKYYPNYEIGKARVPLEERYYAYDWRHTSQVGEGTLFEDYLCSHAASADELLLNVRRLEREVSDGIITYEKYKEVFSSAVEYCKNLAPNIRYIECCNEVDIRGFGNLTADEYVRLYKYAYAAIKELNQKHKYEIPLEIGGYSAALPVCKWDLNADVLRRLKSSEIGECPMDFYSYHHYEAANMYAILDKGLFDVAQMSDIDKLKMILKNHNDLAREIGLPQKPVFLDEVGRAKCTGVKADSIYNAAGVITYLIAFAKHAFENMYLFPWCTFHNPNTQTSYTQFYVNENGEYGATPNGMAIIMLHKMNGSMVDVSITDAVGRDAIYRAIAVKNDSSLYILCVNPTNDIIPNRLCITGMERPGYSVDMYKCNDNFNNCFTANGNGQLSITRTLTWKSHDNRITCDFFLERDAFVLFEIHLDK